MFLAFLVYILDYTDSLPVFQCKSSIVSNHIVYDSDMTG